MRLRWLKRVVYVLALLLVVFVLGWVPWFLAGVATTRQFRFPDRENAGLTPASFHLPFEDATFRSKDGTELRGWWVPAAPTVWQTPSPGSKRPGVGGWRSRPTWPARRTAPRWSRPPWPSSATWTCS